MKITGIIVEYNPLHNGHLHHIQETRQQSGCDVLVAVMSSHFTQRGEPTILDKFTRTKWALAHGVDLVVELPFVLGVQSADLFAKHAVEILHHLGVTNIYFGSESGTIELLHSMLDILDSDEYNSAVQLYLKEGYSYPTASDMAMNLLERDSGFDQPNNILGIQYLRAGKGLLPPIQFHSIPRVQSGYYDEIDPDKHIQSATAIRKLALSHLDLDNYVPSDVAEDLSTKTLVTYDAFAEALGGILHRASASELGRIHHVTEGLEHRIKQVTSFTDIEDLLSQIISRRYTNAKLKRMLACVLCNVTKEDITHDAIPYLRILGMTDAGRNLLGHIKKTISIPLYTKIKEGLHPYLDIELRITKLYNMACETDIYTKEFEPVIY